MNTKMAELLSKSPGKRVVQLTPTGPVLIEGDATSLSAFETHELDESTWNELMELMQTGKVDNAKVKKIIKAKQ